MLHRCEMDNFEFEGKVQDNIAWDLATEATCGPPGELVYAKGVNYKECYYYKRSYNPFVGSEALDNCAWKEVSSLCMTPLERLLTLWQSCKANGASDGWCRDVI